MKQRIVLAVTVLAGASIAGSKALAMAETWFEIKSPNFTVWADANDGNTRTLIWQLEQVRSAMKSVWPWAKVELGKPLLVVAVRNEQSMKSLMPWYWEQRGGVRPGSVWSTGPDYYYIAIRTDMRSRDDVYVNPHASTYFSYVNLILNSSFERDLPLWFSRGIAGVMSNTLVRDEHLVIGAVIPWHLEQLGERRLPLRQMVSVTRESAHMNQQEGMHLFDAQSWAFVHYLMFGDDGKLRPKLDAFLRLIENGKSSDAAFTEAIGNPEEFERALAGYVSRRLFGALKVMVDADVKREKFAARPLSAAESAAGRAALYVTFGRSTEAQEMIATARKAEPANALAHVAEALLLDRDGKQAEAKAAYSKAVELGTTSAYAYYRAAVLNFPQPDEPTLETMEKQLVRAVELNASFAAAHAALAEVRAILKRPQAVIVPHLTRSLKLDPSNAWTRLSAARVLWRLGAVEEARKAAESARTLADDQGARAEAERLLRMIKTP